MMESKSDYNIQKLYKAYDEIDDKFNEVHQNLTFNIEKFHQKKARINSYSTQKINLCLEMIKREKILTEYVNNLILKQKSLKNKKKYLKKETDSQIQALNEETEKANNKLRVLCEEKSHLNKRKQELQIQHKKLTEAIRKSTFAFESIQNYDIESESLSSRNKTLSLFVENNDKTQEKMLEKQNQVDQMNDSIISLRTSIMKTKNAIQDTQIDNQSAKSKILAVQARLNKIQNEFKEEKEEIQKKQNDIINKIQNIEQEKEKLINLKNAVQIHCDNIKQTIITVKSMRKEIKQSIEERSQNISFKDTQIQETKTEIINLQEQKAKILQKSLIQETKNKKTTERINEIRKEIDSVSNSKEETKTQLIEKLNKLGEMQKEIQTNTPLIEEYIKLSNKINDAFVTKEALNDLYKELNNNIDKGLSDFSDNQEINDQRYRIQQIIKSLSNDIVLEDGETNQLIQNIQKQQNKKENYQILLFEIESKINQVKTIDDPLLLSLNSQPTVENVAELLQNLKEKRDKRIERKIRDNQILQKRYEDLIKRIDIRKRKMSRQLKSIEKERDEFDILPDEEKLGIKSIESLYQLSSSIILLWKKRKEAIKNEEVLLSWEKQIDDLYDMLDEFFVRK